MQITDQQFIDAMKKAVEVKGCDNIAPGRYRDHSGAASCIVGVALAQIDVNLVPWDNTHLAHELVTMHGCSERVGVAAHWAQWANDADCIWGEALGIFEKALDMYDRGYRRGSVFDLIMQNACLSAREKSAAAREAKRKQDALAKAQVPKNYVTGGVVESADFDALLAEMSNLNAAIQKSVDKTVAHLVHVAKTNAAFNPTLAAIGIEPPHIKSEFHLSA